MSHSCFPARSLTPPSVLAQLGEAREALTRLQEGDELLERQAARGMIMQTRAELTMPWLAPVWCSAGSMMRDVWSTARSNSLRVGKG